MTSRGCWLIQPATATTRNCNTWGKTTTDGASRAEALGGHDRRDPASVQRRISPSDGVDRVLGPYEGVLNANIHARMRQPYGVGVLR